MLEAPDWIGSGAEETNGLDLLALRAAAMRIGNTLLDGITTITPSTRYLSFIAWITYRYWKRGGRDSRSAYLAFARKMEAAIVLGNHLAAPGVRGLIGTEAQVIRTPTNEISLDIPVKALGTGIYRGVAEQLGLLYTNPAYKVPQLTEARGIPLAEALDAMALETVLGRRLGEESLPQSAPDAELEEFGSLMRVDIFPPQEKELLLSALIPIDPSSPMERRRLATYGAFLSFAIGGQPPNEFRRILAESVRRTRPLPQEFESVLDGWALYLVRDMLAVAHEFAFSAALKVLPKGEAQAPAYLDRHDVLAKVLTDSPRIAGALQDLGLLAPGESWNTITFQEMDARINAATSQGEQVVGGLRRWDGSLQEPAVIHILKTTSDAAPALLPIVWLLAARRTDEGVHTGMSAFDALSQDGQGRLGLKQKVFPLLEDFRIRNICLLEAAASLTNLTVEQHLHTAWSRLADNGNEVAVLLADGEKWAFRKSFSPGHMDSRLNQVWNWTCQLGWTTTEGLTPEGEAVLVRIQASLRQGGL